MRTSVLREMLLEREVDEVLELLGVLVERCLLGVAPGEDGMLALIPAIAELHGARETIANRRRALDRLSEERRSDSDAALDDASIQRMHSALDPDRELELWERLRSLYEEAARRRDDIDRQDVGERGDERERHEGELRARNYWRYAAVCRLLIDPPSHRKPPARSERIGPRWDRDVSLGERRSMARGGNRLYLERLLYDRDPAVVRKLCANPRIVEQDVLTIATRRPNDPVVLREIALSHWLSRYKVRHALALNPFSGTGLVLRLLPLLHARHLAAFRHVGDVHPLVREAAREMVAWRTRLLQRDPVE